LAKTMRENQKHRGGVLRGGGNEGGAKVHKNIGKPHEASQRWAGRVKWNWGRSVFTRLKHEKLVIRQHRGIPGGENNPGDQKGGGMG